LANKKPEKLVEFAVLAYCKDVGWSVDVVDSKASFSKAAGVYKKNVTAAGFPDIVGNLPSGIAVFIELKAKGKLKTLKSHQRMFLEEKLESNCFAAVVDSAELLHNLNIGYLKYGALYLKMFIEDLTLPTDLPI